MNTYQLRADLAREFSSERLVEFGINSESLFEQINRKIDRPSYTGPTHLGALAEHLRAALAEPRTPDIDALARHLGPAAFSVGGIDAFGRHWCSEHGHRAIPTVLSQHHGRVRVVARASIHTDVMTPEGYWGVALHLPCCARALSGPTETVELPPAEFLPWAEARAEALMAETWDEDWGERDGIGQLCCCLEPTKPKRPVDIIYLDGDVVADRYWRLLRDFGFEVRIADLRNEPTYDEDDPVPGYRLDENVDIWRLCLDGHTGLLPLYRNGEDEQGIGSITRDETDELVHLIGLMRR